MTHSGRKILHRSIVTKFNRKIGFLLTEEHGNYQENWIYRLETLSCQFQ